MIWDAILTCARKPTWVSLVYRMVYSRPTTVRVSSCPEKFFVTCAMQDSLRRLCDRCTPNCWRFAVDGYQNATSAPLTGNRTRTSDAAWEQTFSRANCRRRGKILECVVSCIVWELYVWFGWGQSEVSKVLTEVRCCVETLTVRPPDCETFRTAALICKGRFVLTKVIG